MKVLLIGFFARNYMPYINSFEDCLNKNNIVYDLLCFDRESTGPVTLEELTNGKEYIFHYVTGTNPFMKLIPAVKYARFARKLIKRGKYNKLIIFTTMPAVLLRHVLFHEYTGRYIFDYRDITYEKFRPFLRIVDGIVSHSSTTFVSSRGYMSFLAANEKIHYSHNVSNLAFTVPHANGFGQKRPICIGFLGYVRYLDVNSRLADAFSHDEKYKLLYVGTPFADCDLKGYCSEKGINNVDFYGKFRNEEKPGIYEKIDIINSMYSIASREVQPAIPNRLYDAAIFKKPILVTKGTYLSEIVTQYNLGLSVDPLHDDIHQAIETYISNFNLARFEAGCEKFLASIQDEMRIFENIIGNFCKNSN